MKYQSNNFQKFLMWITFFFIITANISAFDPAERFDNNTYIYFEIFPAETSVKKIRQIFFSLMDKEKAESEWKSLGEYFTEQLGINILSQDALKSAGFDISSATGIGLNYTAEKIVNGPDKGKIKYNKFITVILPINSSEKAFNFLRENFYKPPQDSQNQVKYQPVVELEKNRLLRIFDPSKGPMPVFIFRTDDSIIISENLMLVKKYAAKAAQPLNKNPFFIDMKKKFENKKYSSDLIGFFFINQNISDVDTRVRPRLLFDNILMDNAYIKEFSANANFVSGSFTINDAGFKIMVDYNFPKNYLAGNQSFLANVFHFKNQSYFPDNISAPPMAFFKWQTNFQGDNKNSVQVNIINDYDIERFFAKLTGGITAKAPENLKAIFKDNISFYVQDVPQLNDINNYYLWKGYLSMNYNPAHFGKFKQFMKDLEISSKNNKNISIVHSKSGDKLQWQLNISRFLKKYDKLKEQIIYEENIIKLYILADEKQIIITHDPMLSKKIPQQSLASIYDRTLQENVPGKHMIFSYLDIKKFLVYMNKSSLAFTTNYLYYLEKVKSIFFVVNQENDHITEELIIKLDK